jgi:hypothetical protein
MQTNVLQGMRAMICWVHQQRRETQMSKVIAGHVVSRNAVTGMWRAWPTSKDTGSVYADTYRGILAMIRASNANVGA